MFGLMLYVVLLILGVESTVMVTTQYGDGKCSGKVLSKKYLEVSKCFGDNPAIKFEVLKGSALIKQEFGSYDSCNNVGMTETISVEEQKCHSLNLNRESREIISYSSLKKEYKIEESLNSADGNDVVVVKYAQKGCNGQPVQIDYFPKIGPNEKPLCDKVASKKVYEKNALLSNDPSSWPCHAISNHHSEKVFCDHDRIHESSLVVRTTAASISLLLLYCCISLTIMIFCCALGGYFYRKYVARAIPKSEIEEEETKLEVGPEDEGSSYKPLSS